MKSYDFLCIRDIYKNKSILHQPFFVSTLGNLFCFENKSYFVKNLFMAKIATKTSLIACRVIISVSNYLETQKNLLQHAETAILDFGIWTKWN